MTDRFTPVSSVDPRHAQPVPPMPRQHLERPGEEGDMQLHRNSRHPDTGAAASWKGMWR